MLFIWEKKENKYSKFYHFIPLMDLDYLMHMQKDTRILFSSFDMDSNTKILYLTTSFLICMITFKGKLLNKTSIKIPWDMKLQAGIHFTFSNLFKLILKNTLLWSIFSTLLTVYRLTCNEDCFKDRATLSWDKAGGSSRFWKNYF